MSVRWLSAFLDSTPETARACEEFWRSVTGTRISPRRGKRDEFATLLPGEDRPDHLRVQEVIRSVPGGRHLDLHTDDVRGLASRPEELGVSASYHVLARPEGMPLRLLLQRLGDERPGVSAHLDLACDDRDAEAARHLALGAEHVRRTDWWTTLRDPAGRDYCLTRRDLDAGTVL